MNKIAIIGIVLIVVAVGSIGYFAYTGEDVDIPGFPDPEYWEWSLIAPGNGNNGNNEVTFTQEQINACNSDSPADVFASVNHDCILNYVFEDQTWLNYWFCSPNDPEGTHIGGTLKNIQPGIIYLVFVSQDCTLKIEKP